MSASEWYYAVGDERKGPVSPVQLKALAASGELKPDDLVWKEGVPDWVPADSVAGLFPTPAPATTADEIDDFAPAAPGGPPPIGRRPGPAPRHYSTGPSVGDYFMATVGVGGILVAAGGLVMFIGALIPWASGGFTSVNGFWYWEGILSFIFSLAAIVLVILHHLIPPMKPAIPGLSIGYTAVGGLTVIFCVVALIRIGKAMSVGPWFTLVGGGLVVAGGILLLLAAFKPARR